MISKFILYFFLLLLSHMSTFSLIFVTTSFPSVPSSFPSFLLFSPHCRSVAILSLIPPLFFSSLLSPLSVSSYLRPPSLFFTLSPPFCSSFYFPLSLFVPLILLLSIPCHTPLLLFQLSPLCPRYIFYFIIFACLSPFVPFVFFVP